MRSSITRPFETLAGPACPFGKQTDDKSWKDDRPAGTTVQLTMRAFCVT